MPSTLRECYDGCGLTEDVYSITVQIDREYMDSRFIADSCLRNRHVNCGRCGGYAHTVAASDNEPESYPDPSRLGRHLCVGCNQYMHPACAGCGNPTGRNNTHRVTLPDGSRNVLMCNGCVRYCDENDHYVHPESIVESEYDDDDDTRCLVCDARRVSERDQIRGYGRTHPSKWYGGPLPRVAGKMQGFYLGFELEISTSSRTAKGIRDWEDEHNMSGFFDAKQDSSVQGFEIATQPFTPEYFETMIEDGRLASFFDMLNREYPSLEGTDRDGFGVEPNGHGLHVHIGRIAFAGDDTSLASYAYLVGQDNGAHLQRIGRRRATNYCNTVAAPVKSVIVHTKNESGTGRGLSQEYVDPATGNWVMRTNPRNRNQYGRLTSDRVRVGRDAINLTNGKTVELRAFKSTRNWQELADAIRLTYLPAQYIRSLRPSKKSSTLSPTALHWDEFCKWVGANHPDAYPAMSGSTEPIKKKKSKKPGEVKPVEDGIYSIGEVDFETVRAAVEEMTPAQKARLERRHRKALIRSGIDPDVPREVAPPRVAQVAASGGDLRVEWTSGWVSEDSTVTMPENFTREPTFDANLLRTSQVAMPRTTRVGQARALSRSEEQRRVAIEELNRLTAQARSRSVSQDLWRIEPTPNPAPSTPDPWWDDLSDDEETEF